MEGLEETLVLSQSRKRHAKPAEGEVQCREAGGACQCQGEPERPRGVTWSWSRLDRVGLVFWILSEQMLYFECNP